MENSFSKQLLKDLHSHSQTQIGKEGYIHVSVNFILDIGCAFKRLEQRIEKLEQQILNSTPIGTNKE